MTPTVNKKELETLEILNDSELMNELKLSRKESKRGKSVQWKKVKIPV